MKRQKSILVVDDETQLGELVLELLSPLYEEVLFCSSPLDAKNLLASRTFSLILSDIQMPEMSGPELVKLMRSIGRIEPVAFLTGNATKEAVLSALRLGAADVIEKPFSNDDLLQTIDRIFEIERRRMQLYEATFSKKLGENTLRRQKRMIGLLQVVNGSK